MWRPKQVIMKWRSGDSETKGQPVKDSERYLEGKLLPIDKG
jgi:hypothetical protein